MVTDMAPVFVLGVIMRTIVSATTSCRLVLLLYFLRSIHLKASFTESRTPTNFSENDI